MTEVPNRAAEAIEALGDSPTPEQVHEATLQFETRDVAAAAATIGGGGSTVTFSDTEPDAPAEGDLWLRELGEANSFQGYVYGGGAWRPISAGVGAPATVGLFSDIANRQVGHLMGDPDDGNFLGLQVDQSAESVVIQSVDADGDTNAFVDVTPTRAALQHGSARLSRDATGWRISGLPTVDPAVANYLWNDGGTLKVSAG